jgi:hypothetical protein
MAFLRSLWGREDEKPVVQGIGARHSNGVVRVDVLLVTERVPRARRRFSLDTSAGSTPVTLHSPGLEPGAYQHVTLEVAA